MADIFQMTFLNASSWIKMFDFRLKFVPKVQINNILPLVQIMARRLIGTKPSSEPMMALFTDAYMHHSASMG